MSHRRPSRKLPSHIRVPPIYRRHPILSVIITIAVVSALYQRSAPPTPTATPAGGDYVRYHDRTFTVTRVVDGDTLDIDIPDRDKPTTRIRLWGVDTPEVKGSPKGEMYWGQEASEFAKKTLTGTRVRIELVENNTRGKYGRLLAYVYDAETDLFFNETLLRGGYAYADRRFPHPRRDAFITLETQARQNGVGLWRNVTEEQLPGWRRRYDH